MGGPKPLWRRIIVAGIGAQVLALAVAAWGSPLAPIWLGVAVWTLACAVMPWEDE